MALATPTRDVDYVRLNQLHPPGTKSNEQVQNMYDLICQRVWQRPCVRPGDRTNYGVFINEDVDYMTRFIVDNGPPESEEYTTLLYKYKDNKFSPVRRTPYTEAELNYYRFDGTWNRHSLDASMTKKGWEEHRASLGEKFYSIPTKRAIRYTRRTSRYHFSGEDGEFLRDHPDFLEELNREFPDEKPVELVEKEGEGGAVATMKSPVKLAGWFIRIRGESF